MSEDKKTTFTKISVKPDVKRDIDIIAATEQRHVYEIVDDMLKLYKETQEAQSQSPKLKKRIRAERLEPVAA